MQPFEHSETLGKIAAALVKLQAAVKAIQLTGRNDFAKYDYMKEEELIFALRPLLEENKLAFLKSLQSVEDLTYSPAKGYGTRVVLCGMLIHESGEWIRFYSAGDGLDSADKGVYKAITGASKYLMAKTFGFPTGDDPEGDTAVDKSAANPPKKESKESKPPSKSSGKTKNFEFLKSMGVLKQQLIDIAGDEKGQEEYYRVLNSFKFQKADAITDRQDQTDVYHELIRIINESTPK